MVLRIKIEYADEKTVEEYDCSDFPNVNSDFITLYLVNFARKTINAKSVLKMESRFI